MKRTRRAAAVLLAAALALALGAGVIVGSPDTASPWSVVGGAGGGSAASTNYALNATAGQPSAGPAGSIGYNLGAGYWYGAGDGDGDRLLDIFDPCPATADCDIDGWTDWSEAVYIGTDPLDDCADNASDDAWPADVNNDTFSDITDIVALAGWFGSAVPPAPARYNIAPDPLDGFVDITDIVAMAGLFGESCAP